VAKELTLTVKRGSPLHVGSLGKGCNANASISTVALFEGRKGSDKSCGVSRDDFGNWLPFAAELPVKVAMFCGCAVELFSAIWQNRKAGNEKIRTTENLNDLIISLPSEMIGIWMVRN
jgi:hypothetical protein